MTTAEGRRFIKELDVELSETELGDRREALVAKKHGPHQARREED